MTGQYAAAAYVQLLRAQVATASHEKLMMEADQRQAAYAYARAAERLLVLQEVLAEAVKLMNALTSGSEWFIQQDGTVRTASDRSLITNDRQVRMGDL